MEELRSISWLYRCYKVINSLKFLSVDFYSILCVYDQYVFTSVLGGDSVDEVP